MKIDEFNGNMAGMARQGLKVELVTTILEAIAKKEEARYDKLRVKTNGEDQLIILIVNPIWEPASRKGLFMVIFEDVPEAKKRSAKRKKSYTIREEQHPRIRELEHELGSTREYLQVTVEELETANEEPKSTNEELQSSNEELQSTNEEPAASKEELQSVNEELVTVNLECW